MCTRFLKNVKGTARVITTTTRAPREGERDGIDYYFETNEHFITRLGKGYFLEYAQVYGYYYGVSKQAIFGEKNADKDLIMCTDVQGAQTLKAKLSVSTMGCRLVTIFVSPASLDELRNRLIKRGTDDEQTIQKRLQMAEKELRTLHQFDYHLCSQDREHDWLCLQHIYYSEKMRI